MATATDSRHAGRHREGYGVVLIDHVFDKVRSIDMTLAEFEVLIDGGEVIEDTPIKVGAKELVLIVVSRPLHVVVVVDDIRTEERIVTVHEPEEDRWSPDFKVRKRGRAADGNKRAAWAALVLFIDLNGGRWNPDPRDVDDALCSPSHQVTSTRRRCRNGLGAECASGSGSHQ
jgi:hypothetical protein